METVTGERRSTARSRGGQHGEHKVALPVAKVWIGSNGHQKRPSAFPGKIEGAPSSSLILLRCDETMNGFWRAMRWPPMVSRPSAMVSATRRTGPRWKRLDFAERTKLCIGPWSTSSLRGEMKDLSAVQ